MKGVGRTFGRGGIFYFRVCTPIAASGFAGHVMHRLLTGRVQPT